MRKAIIEYPCNQGQHEATLLRNGDDLLEYFGKLSDDSSAYLTRLLRSGAHPERYDHMIPGGPVGQVMTASVVSCKLHGRNPILEFDSHFNKLQQGMVKTLMSGRNVIINPNGGYFGSDDESIVIREWDEQPSNPDTYHIAWGCKIINLENDECLEPRTLEYMKSHDYNSKEEFSYITEFHRYDTEALTEIFLKFYGAGGDEVYVYTTGINVNQMYDYLDAAIAAGLSSLVIEFNAGVTDEIQEFIDHATACDITFKYTF